MAVTQGQVSPGEYDYVFTPRRTERAGKAGVLYLRGAATPNTFANPAWSYMAILARQVTAAGFPGVAQQMGSTDLWGNGTSLTRITTMQQVLTGGTVATAPKCILVGMSMGHGAALTYAAAFPQRVAGIVGIIPMANMDYHYQNDLPTGAQAGIGTAWGVTYPTALPAGANLSTAAAAVAAAKIPHRMYYSTVDPYVRTSDVTAIAAVTGALAYPVDSTFGHANGAVKQIDPANLISFLRACAP